MPLIDIDPPASDPITLDDVKGPERIDGTEFDAQLALVIKALCRHVEGRLGRALITQTKELVIDRFPCGEIDLQLPDVQSIVSLKYIDVDGVERLLASNAYALEKENTPCWLAPAYGTDWPETLVTVGAVRVRFRVGYGDTAAAVPSDIRLWMIAHASQILRNPDGLSEAAFKPLPFVDGLLDQYKVWRVA